MTVDEVPELFEEMDASCVQASIRSLFARACRFVNRALGEGDIESLYEGVEAQYSGRFWSLLDKSGAAKRLGGGSVGRFLKAHPECISSVLEFKSLVEGHGVEIREALLNSPLVAAKIIIGQLATQSFSKRELMLPAELTNDDLNSIMLDYLNGDHPNLNYVKVLASWPYSSVSRYKPSPDVAVLAQRVEKKCLEEMFAEGIALRYGTGVCIDGQQTACKGITVERFDATHTFGGEWLGLYVDPATIMNNCIYVFDYVDLKGIMTMPARAHEETALLESLGLHALDEYRTTHAYQMRNGLALLETIAYADFLDHRGIRFEDALEWVFNQYFEEEFGIKGFSLSLPAKESTWLDKCKSIGPEIERVIKAYAGYAKRGVIDDAYFPYEPVKSFIDLPSLNGNKYAVPGTQFETRAYHLFSDQSLLAYNQGKSEGCDCFFDLTQSQNVFRTDYHDAFQPIIDRLVGDNLVREDGPDGALALTYQALLMRTIWEMGVIPLKHCNAEERNLLEELVDKEVLSYRNTLFTPDEARYLNYVFNDAFFSNSLGLRNRYDHASAAISDPNSDTMKNDYYQLLTILIAITLKINGELQDKTGKGGPIDFVDWPLYDDSVLRTAAQLAARNSEGGPIVGPETSSSDIPNVETLGS